MRLIKVRTLALVSAVALAACSSGGDTGNQGAGTQGKAAGKGDGGQPPQVGYVVVQQTRVPLMTELPGRTFAYQSSEVRPQVSGVIQKRLFKEGSLVRQGQPLYQIDPSL